MRISVGIGKLSNDKGNQLFNWLKYRLANSRLRWDFPRPPGAWRRRRHLWVPTASPLGHLRRLFGQPLPSAALKEKKNWGTMGAPYLGCRGRPGRVVSLAYAAFGGDKKKNSGASGATFKGRLRRPK